MSDFTLAGRMMDTVFLLTPVSKEAKAWVDEHIPEDTITLGHGIAVEHRYVDAIVGGIEGDGLTIEQL